MSSQPGLGGAAASRGAGGVASGVRRAPTLSTVSSQPVASSRDGVSSPGEAESRDSGATPLGTSQAQTPTAVLDGEVSGRGRRGADVGPRAAGRAELPLRSRKLRRQRFQARRVRRLVRHIDPWSVFKLSLVFFLCVWVILMIAGVMLWQVAQSSGQITNVEDLIRKSFGYSEMKIDGEFLFRQYAVIGFVMALTSTGAAVVGSILFNLISDLVGGIWMSVIEEETARPVGR